MLPHPLTTLYSTLRFTPSLPARRPIWLHAPKRPDKLQKGWITTSGWITTLKEACWWSMDQMKGGQTRLSLSHRSFKPYTYIDTRPRQPGGSSTLAPGPVHHSQPGSRHLTLDHVTPAYSAAARPYSRATGGGAMAAMLVMEAARELMGELGPLSSPMSCLLRGELPLLVKDRERATRAARLLKAFRWKRSLPAGMRVGEGLVGERQVQYGV